MQRSQSAVDFSHLLNPDSSTTPKDKVASVKKDSDGDVDMGGEAARQPSAAPSQAQREKQTISYDKYISIVNLIVSKVAEDETQGSLFVERARLSEGFFEQLKRHPVPLEEPAIRAVNNNSMALDLYAWLAYRLHALKGPTPVSWRALKPQFGMGFGRMDNFRARFLDNLKLTLAVYPAARVEVDEAGLILHPSRPPVSPKARPALR